MRGVFITLGRDLRPLNLFVAAGRTYYHLLARQADYREKDGAIRSEVKFILKARHARLLFFNLRLEPMSIDSEQKTYFCLKYTKKH